MLSVIMNIKRFIIGRWDGWTGYVDDDMVLMYEIEYRQVQDIGVVDKSNHDIIEEIPTINEEDVNDIPGVSVEGIDSTNDQSDGCENGIGCSNKNEKKGDDGDDEIKNDYTIDTKYENNEKPKINVEKSIINEESGDMKKKSDEIFYAKSDDNMEKNNDIEDNENIKMDKSVSEKKRRSNIIENNIASLKEPIAKESNEQSKSEKNDEKYKNKEALKQNPKQGEWKVGGLVDRDVVEFSIRNLSINSYYQFRVGSKYFYKLHLYN